MSLLLLIPVRSITLRNMMERLSPSQSEMESVNWSRAVWECFADSLQTAVPGVIWRIAIGNFLFRVLHLHWCVLNCSHVIERMQFLSCQQIQMFLLGLFGGLSKSTSISIFGQSLFSGVYKSILSSLISVEDISEFWSILKNHQLDTVNLTALLFTHRSNKWMFDIWLLETKIIYR